MNKRVVNSWKNVASMMSTISSKFDVFPSKTSWKRTNILKKNCSSIFNLINVKNHRLATNQLNFQHFSNLPFFSVAGKLHPYLTPGLYRNCKASLAFWRKIASSLVQVEGPWRLFSEIFLLFQKTPGRFTFLGQKKWRLWFRWFPFTIWGVA